MLGCIQTLFTQDKYGRVMHASLDKVKNEDICGKIVVSSIKEDIF